MKQTTGRTTVPPSRRDAPPLRDNPTKLYQSNVTSKPPVHSNNGVINGLGSNNVNNSRVQNKPSMPDIAKRPIRYV